ncbi:hypothetical protein PSTT_04038 [Puccinia striiformis]|uniref:L-ornithine N(5)-monooxygenase [NAD(P)H] n=1 Tax=Puccinia striiformis TaxID=27350 RepID=A0A2S4VU45_9BASI|nr:hypothetical protein PSTT_04038 [Puccinia striiformis]
MNEVKCLIRNIILTKLVCPHTVAWHVSYDLWSTLRSTFSPPSGRAHSINPDIRLLDVATRSTSDKKLLLALHRFLKDLVTLRNPCSPFSFLNYLHCQKRLVDFINRATFTPTRLEFADYLAWVARHVTSSSPPSASSSGTHDSGTRKENSLDLCYGERVVAVEGVRGPTGDIDFLRVSSTKSSNGSIRRYLCRNLVISAGGIPRVPEPFQDIGFESPKKSCHVIHTSTFLQHIDHPQKNYPVGFRLSNQSEARANSRGTRQPIENLGLDRSNSPSSINSVPSTDGLTSCSSAAELESVRISSRGTEKNQDCRDWRGSSAAETLLETYSRLKPLMASVNGLGTSGEIDLIIKQGHLRPSDDSPFSNEVFNPQSTDFSMTERRRACPKINSSAHKAWS